MSKILKFVKSEPVLCVAAVIAGVSCCWVRPSVAYLGYINWKTLGILLAMMIVVQLLHTIGIFDYLVQRILLMVNSSKTLVLALVLACFFCSIFITNDIALITFVPFAIGSLMVAGLQDLIIWTVTLQTIAANLGSMIMPIGSPQNIQIFTVSGMSVMDFFTVIFPYWIVSLVILVIASLAVPKREISGRVGSVEIEKKPIGAIVRETLSGVDYCLLLTFVAFYILIGNLSNIPSFVSLINGIVTGNELWCSIIASQVISNVPACVMLCGFTSNYPMLLVGLNLGGLGTLIASMANLISYNILAHQVDKVKGKYIIVFTIANLVMLAILIGVYFVI